MNPQDTPTPTEETTEDAIPYGYCHCGCGQKTRISDYTKLRYGWRKGEPRKFVNRHYRPPIIVPDVLPNPSGLCQCGCGEPAPIARHTDNQTGVARGFPAKFIKGHESRKDNRPVELRDGVGYIPIRSAKYPDLYTLVDEADVDLASRFRWHHSGSARRRYAITHTLSPLHTSFGLHRLLMDFPDGLYVDHINGDGLDNRRINLRICTAQQNARNSRANEQIGLSSVYKGVHWAAKDNAWRASIGLTQDRRRTKSVGFFDQEEDAARAYDDAARELFGEFGTYNFPRSGERSALTGEIEP